MSENYILIYFCIFFAAYLGKAKLRTSYFVLNLEHGSISFVKNDNPYLLQPHLIWHKIGMK